jgi:hypothetical protein
MITQSQVLSFTEAFPPAHKMTETLMNINYKKHLNSYMDAITNLCAFVAAIATVLYDKWNQYNMTERVQLWSLTAYTWTREVAVPAVKNAVTVTYKTGKNVREVYEVLSSPLFITL